MEIRFSEFPRCAIGRYVIAGDALSAQIFWAGDEEPTLVEFETPRELKEELLSWFLDKEPAEKFEDMWEGFICSLTAERWSLSEVQVAELQEMGTIWSAPDSAKTWNWCQCGICSPEFALNPKNELGAQLLEAISFWNKNS
jgi:hypothetical protein